MTTAQIPMISPPPSVEAVLGALTEETRIGQVDFSSRLAPEPEQGGEPEAESNAVLAETATDPVDPADEVDEVDEVAEADLEPRPDPEVAGGTGLESPRDDAPVADVVTLTLASVPPLPERRPAKPKKAKKRALPQAAPVEGHAMPDAPDAPDRSLEDRITGPANLSAHTTGTAPTRPTGTILPETADLGDFERPPTIEEIARAVVERMHDAELAMMRHLEAVEFEAARRAELATAQAELDAELIRLHARREAHAIVADARERAGQEPQDDQADRADRALDEVTESLTRFADVMEELRPSTRPGHRP